MSVSTKKHTKNIDSGELRLAVVASHPVQYYAPIFRDLSTKLDLTVYYTQEATAKQQANAGFGTSFSWDIDLRGGYKSELLKNVSPDPNPSRFSGADTPGVRKVLRDNDFDAVLVIGWYLKAFLQAILAAKLSGLPVIVRGDNQIGMPGGMLKRVVRSIGLPVFLRLFNAACYVGVNNRAYYEKYAYPGHRLFKSPHAVDTERFSTGATAEAREGLRARLGVGNEPLVLFAGKLVDFKRPLDAVDALAYLRERGISASLMVVGSGLLEESITARALELDVPIFCLGFQNQTQMPAVYAAADVLLLPSTSRETWGLVANEALASGTPVVLSESVGSAPDLAADGYVGRSFSTGDIVKAADALALTIRNPPDLVSIEEVSDRYSIEAASDGIIAATKAVCRAS